MTTAAFPLSPRTTSTLSSLADDFDGLFSIFLSEWSLHSSFDGTCLGVSTRRGTSVVMSDGILDNDRTKINAGNVKTGCVGPVQ